MPSIFRYQGSGLKFGEIYLLEKYPERRINIKSLNKNKIEEKTTGLHIVSKELFYIILAIR